jgi:amino acid transporter
MSCSILWRIFLILEWWKIVLLVVVAIIGLWWVSKGGDEV